MFEYLRNVGNTADFYMDTTNPHPYPQGIKIIIELPWMPEMVYLHSTLGT